MSLRVRFIESEIKFEDFMIFCYGKVNDFGFSSIGVNAKNVRNAEKAVFASMVVNAVDVSSICEGLGW